MTRIKLFAIGTLLFASTAQAKIPEATSENAIGLIAMLFTYQHECSPSGDDLDQRDARTAIAFATVAGIDLTDAKTLAKIQMEMLRNAKFVDKFGSTAKFCEWADRKLH
jgi:hypothetical protein